LGDELTFLGYFCDKHLRLKLLKEYICKIDILSCLESKCKNCGNEATVRLWLHEDEGYLVFD